MSVASDLELGERAAELGKARDPVCRLTDSSFEGGVDVVDDHRIKARAGHHEEVPLFGGIGELADGNTLGNPFVHAFGCTDDAGTDLHLDGEDVCGSTGQDGQRDFGSNKAIGNFIDGAIAASGDDESCSFDDAVPRNGGRIAGSGGGYRCNVLAAIPEGFDGTLKKLSAFPVELTRTRVIDEERVVVNSDKPWSST